MVTVGFVSDCQQAKEALTSLAAEDVACLPLLFAPELEPLLHAARALTYRTAWREVGSGDQVVRQDYAWRRLSLGRCGSWRHGWRSFLALRSRRAARPCLTILSI